MKTIAILITFALLTSAWSEEIQTWGYSENGHDWADTCRAGARQSPINILSSDVRACSITNPDVSLSFLNSQVKTVLKLEDQTLRDSLSEKVAFLTAPDVNGISQSYALANIHFHTYSEHQIDSINAKLEMHMVRINLISKKFCL
jgi:carbonic anhydrase